MPKRATKAGAAAPSAPAHPFAAYKNPFITGEARAWAPERLIVYTYEAVQAWAKERGIDFPPQQTPREFCADLGEKFPDVGPELSRLTFYYAHAAYGKHLPDSYDPAPVRELWRRISDAA
jgi:hypothetical protein